MSSRINSSLPLEDLRVLFNADRMALDTFVFTHGITPLGQALMLNRFDVAETLAAEPFNIALIEEDRNRVANILVQKTLFDLNAREMNRARKCLSILRRLGDGVLWLGPRIVNPHSLVQFYARNTDVRSFAEVFHVNFEDDDTPIHTNNVFLFPGFKEKLFLMVF